MKGFGNFSKNIFSLFNLLMILLYVAAGIMLIFAPALKDVFPEFNRIGLAVIFWIYAIYRSYKFFLKFITKNSLINSNDQ